MQNFSLLACLALFSSACISASKHILEPFNFEDATRIFREQLHDTPGVWFCSYRDHKTSPSEALIVEIDEKYLYIKINNKLIELIRASEENKIIFFTNASERLGARMKILSRSNFSEYEESHDRTAEVEIITPHGKKSLQLIGEACGV